MKKLKALIYPATYPRKYTCLRLAQAFEALSVLLPTERSVISCPDIEVESIVPAPLNEKIQWFDDMLKHWRSWAGQVGLGNKISSSTILNALSTGDESVHEIIRSMKGGETSDPLMESRLFLQLAHEGDMESEEIDSEYSSIIVQEQRIKSLFSGEEKGRSKQYADYPLPSLNHLFERFRAWFHLLNEADFKGCMVGEGIGMKDMLDNAYEKMEPGKTSIDLLRFKLPSNPDTKPSEDNEFKKRMHNLIEVITNGNIDNAKEISEEFSAFLDESYEHGKDGNSPDLCLSVYPDRTLKSVMACAAWDKDIKEKDSAGWSFFLY